MLRKRYMAVVTLVCIIPLVVAATIYSIYLFSILHSSNHLPQNIILVIWDGTERQIFNELLKGGNLTFVSTLHVYNLTCNTEYGAGTGTRPQHAIMLTGYLADITNIVCNNPGANVNGTFQLAEGLSIFERAKALNPKWTVAGATGKPNNVGDLLGFFECDVYWNSHGFDIFDNRAGEITDYPPDMFVEEGHRAEDRYLDLARNKSPFLYMFHFSDPDHTGHHENPEKPENEELTPYGVHSIQYRQAIVNCDRVTEKIYEKLAISDPVIIVLSDHGFGSPKPYGHNDAPNTFIASNVPLRNGYMVDVAPTIYKLMAIDTDLFTPPIQGQPLCN